MRYFVFAASIVASSSAAMAQAPATDPAQPAPAGGEMRTKLLAMDTDRDGRWSKAEWIAGGRRERGFAMMDGDGDGYLSPAELKAGAEKFQNRRAR